jgi:glycine cleavage system H lipoate-binding protein
MQAGVVRRKPCATDHQCHGCRFNKALQKAAAANRRLRRSGKLPKGAAGRIVSWQERLRELPAGRQPCVHHMKGRIDFRACTHDYRCSNCEFDQYFDDQFSVHAVVKPIDVIDIKGFKVPQGFYLHRGHAWVKIEEGSVVRIGLDDFAMRIFGPLDRIEAPLLGKQVLRDRADVVLQRGEMTARFLSPVSGVVTDINPRLRETAQTAHQDPYGDGWVLRAHCETLRSDLKHLMITAETGRFLSTEVNRLYREIETVAGPLAADGGYLTNDIYGCLPQLGWRRLARTFLHT